MKIKIMTHSNVSTNFYSTKTEKMWNETKKKLKNIRVVYKKHLKIQKKNKKYEKIANLINNKDGEEESVSIIKQHQMD